MVRSDLPIYVYASQAARALIGPELERVARLAVKAIVSNRRTLEIAFQQIEYRKHWLALSSRVTSRGDIVVEVDVGDPSLGSRIILEDELRRAEGSSRQEARKVQEARRRLGRSGTR